MKLAEDVNGLLKRKIRGLNLSMTSTFLPKFSWSIVRIILIIGICYIIMFPLISKIPPSFMTESQLFDRTVNWIPRELTLSNYSLVFNRMNYLTSFFNSLMLTMTTTLLQLISCTIVGYGLARFKFWGRGLLFSLVIFMLVVPPQVIMLPLYLNFRYFDFLGLLSEPGINLLGSFWPFILMGMTATGFRNGLFIYIMVQFFKGMPNALEEAASIDGAGPYTTFYKIMLPGALSAILVVFLFSFVWQWNDYLYTSMFLGNADVLPIRLDRLVERSSDFMEIRGPGETIINNTGMLMFMAPLLVLYAFMQRYFIESIERSGLIS